MNDSIKHISEKQQSAKGGGIPRLAMFNDVAGFGRCSAALSLPVISAMQVQVCPVPTSILSNHLGFPAVYLDDYTAHLKDYLHVWKQLGISFDGLYCGFLTSPGQAAVVEEFIADFHPGFFLLDPVLGDHGKLYSTVTQARCDSIRKLLSYADLITPNITEACLLTNTSYKADNWCDYELQRICEKLSLLCPGKIVITGLQSSRNVLNYIWQHGCRSTYSVRKTGASRPGTGDLFASILAADAVNGVPLEQSVKKAADFTALCIEGSEEARTPVQEGVLFEKYLGKLIP